MSWMVKEKEKEKKKESESGLSTWSPIYIFLNCSKKESRASSSFSQPPCAGEILELLLKALSTLYQTSVFYTARSVHLAESGVGQLHQLQDPAHQLTVHGVMVLGDNIILICTEIQFPTEQKYNSPFSINRLPTSLLLKLTLPPTALPMIYTSQVRRPSAVDRATVEEGEEQTSWYSRAYVSNSCTSSWHVLLYSHRPITDSWSSCCPT